MIKLEQAVTDITQVIRKKTIVPEGWQVNDYNIRTVLVKKIERSPKFKYIKLSILPTGSLRFEYHDTTIGQYVTYEITTEGFIITAAYLAARLDEYWQKQRENELFYPPEKALAEIGQLALALQTNLNR
jgi:hypothetical protein